MCCMGGNIQYPPEYKRRGRDLIWLMGTVKDGSWHVSLKCHNLNFV